MLRDSSLLVVVWEILLFQNPSLLEYEACVYLSGPGGCPLGGTPMECKRHIRMPILKHVHKGLMEVGTLVEIIIIEPVMVENESVYAVFFGQLPLLLTRFELGIIVESQ